MDTILAKIFKSNSDAQLVYKNYALTDDYYCFVKKCSEIGLRQVIITSEMMISLLRHYFFSRSSKITNIEFMVDDEELSAGIKVLLQKLLDDRAYWGELQKQLEFLNECESIDIKRVEIKGMSADKNAFSLFVQVNGIFGISNNVYESEAIELIKIIKGCLNT